MDPFFGLASLLLCIIGATIAWTFVFTYSGEPFQWKTYEAGRHLMRFTRGLAVVLTWSCAVFIMRFMFGEPRWFLALVDLGRVAIFGWAAAMLWSRLKILLRTRRQYLDELEKGRELIR